MIIALALIASPAQASTMQTPVYTKKINASCGVDRNGVLTIKLAHGKTRQYKDNLEVANGTFVSFHCTGYLRKINAYRIDMERMENQTLLVQYLTGREIDVGATFSISPEGSKILSSDCSELGCWFNMIAWPSGKVEYFRNLSLDTALSDDRNREAIGLISPASVRWKSNRKVSFEAKCTKRNGARGYQAIVLAFDGKNWAQQQKIKC